MVRSLLYALAGLLLGLLIHLVIILTLPLLAEDSIAKRVDAAAPDIGKTVLLADVTPGDANPLHLDPDLSYAICRLDLRQGPGEVVGTLPTTFWSVAVFDHGGTVIYSTTNRDLETPQRPRANIASVYLGHPLFARSMSGITCLGSNSAIVTRFFCGGR